MFPWSRAFVKCEVQLRNFFLYVYICLYHVQVAPPITTTTIKLHPNIVEQTTETDTTNTVAATVDNEDKKIREMGGDEDDIAGLL